MQRRLSDTIVLALLVALTLLDAYLLAAAVIQGGPMDRMSWVAPQGDFFDQLAITTNDLSWYLVSGISVAAFLSVFPRPVLWKLVVVTILLLTVMFADLCSAFHLARRGTIHLADGDIIVYGPGVLSWFTMLEALWHAKTTLLAWTRWHLRRKARRSTGHCPSCDYSLAGAASDRCPECGVHIRPMPSASSVTVENASPSPRK